MIVATEDSNALWLELFFNNMAPNTDSMCAIRSNPQNCPFDQTSSVFIIFMFDFLYNSLGLHQIQINLQPEHKL